MSAPYGWIITKDHISSSDDDQTGTYGPNGLGAENVTRLHAGEGKPFRMLDDDGELYYEGLLLGEDTQGFEPLDDFGLPNAGCTEIQFRNASTNAWEPL